MTVTAPAQQGPGSHRRGGRCGRHRREATTWLPGTGFLPRLLLVFPQVQAQQQQTGARAPTGHRAARGPAAPTLARQPRWPHSGRRGPQLAPRCFRQTGTPLPPHRTPHLLKINRTQGDLLLKGHFPRRPQDSASPKARKVIQLGRGHGHACRSDWAC